MIWEAGVFVQSISVTIQRWADQGYLHYKGVGGGGDQISRKKALRHNTWMAPYKDCLKGEILPTRNVPNAQAIRQPCATLWHDVDGEANKHIM